MNAELTAIAIDTGEIVEYVVESEADTSNTGDTPTIEETAGRIGAALTGHPFISDLMNIPQLGASGGCPVFTFDLGAYGSHNMTIHCTVLNNHANSLSLIFIGLWTLLAGIVFLRA